MNQEFKYQHPGTGITPELNYVIRLLKHEAERAHAAAPCVGTQIVLMDYLEKIVKIKTDVNRLAEETKRA